MLLFCLNILVLVFLAAPARARHLPETVLGFQTAPKQQEKPESEQSRIRPPLPAGGPAKDPAQTGPSRVHQSVATLHKKTQFIRTLFSNPAPELGSETALPFWGPPKDCICVPTTYLF